MLFVLKQSGMCYYIICMTLPLKAKIKNKLLNFENEVTFLIPIVFENLLIGASTDSKDVL